MKGGYGTKDMRRPINDGSTRRPDWNAPLSKPPLNQGANFQQELIDRGLRSEQAVEDYLKETGRGT